MYSLAMVLEGGMTNKQSTAIRSQVKDLIRVILREEEE
jgi:hypothetical protein